MAANRVTVGLAIGVLLLALAAPPSAHAAATWIVNSASDAGDSSVGNGICATSTGACTLRAAIQEANALAGPDTIEFAIGSGLQTIAAASQLPTITSPVTIDGTSQPGFSGSPIIVLDGGGSTGGLTVTAGSTVLRGLVLIRFAGDGLTLRGAGGNVIETCYIGMAADGTTAAGNSASGIVVDGSPNNRIGGRATAQRNLISGNTGKGAGGGVHLLNTTGNVIQGNFIGTDVSGMLDRGNEGRGITMNDAPGNRIGGPEPGAGNLIAGNRATGVRVMSGSDNNLIQGNFLGVNRAMTDFISNDRGVQLRGAHGNQVIANMIAGHVYDGVLIWEGASNNLVYSNVVAYNGRGPIGDPTEAAFNGILVHSGSGNTLVSNLIFDNGLMGIELGNAFGVTPNDAGDGDSGANNFQNFPVLSAATLSGGSLVVSGTLNSTASSSFLVQLFSNPTCDSSASGEGRFVLGHGVVTTNASGNGSFSMPVAPQGAQAGWFVTATATGPGGNTSEFSACLAVK